MEKKKKYYKGIDLIRVIACIAVLLYHLNILKGGYLAVCIFFVLSGYLSCVSAFKNEKFSYSNYYLNRLKGIYLPLIIVTFITVFITKLIPGINWISLKPEVKSIIFGYNNFWQLNANLDYFARHIDSPFMHFWYMSILLQFDFIFPFIFSLLKKMGQKVSKVLPCMILLILSVASTIFFYKTSQNNIMNAYYGSLTRVFSLLFGVLLGFIHKYYKPLVLKVINNSRLKRFTFIFHILICLILFIYVDAKSKYFILSMILISVLSCRLLDYAVIMNNEKTTVFDGIMKYLSKISYEIYLIQYPVIFILQYILLKGSNIILIIFTTLILSMILNFVLNSKIKNKSLKVLRYIAFSLVIIIALFGVYKFIISKDLTIEMKKLEDELNQNEKFMKARQTEYDAKQKEEEEKWKNELENFNGGTENLKNIVTNLKIVGVGDSIMLGAINGLYKTFPNSYIDAKVSRSVYVAAGILQDLKNRNKLSDVVILNLGANGDCPESCKTKIVDTVGNRKLFWINVTNDSSVHINKKLNALAKKYKNVHIVDWEKASKGHPEYFAADGIHLNKSGIVAYSKAIYDSIYNVYLEEYNLKKQQLIDEHEENKKNEISFYGNDILLNSFKYIQEKLPNSKFIANQKFDYDSLKEQLISDIKSEKLSYKVIFMFDNTTKLTEKQYDELINICKDHEVYVLSLNKNKIKLENEAKIIDFYSKMQSNLAIDGVHLTADGNKMLSDALFDSINNK